MKTQLDKNKNKNKYFFGKTCTYSTIKVMEDQEYYYFYILKTKKKENKQTSEIINEIKLFATKSILYYKKLDEIGYFMLDHIEEIITISPGGGEPFQFYLDNSAIDTNIEIKFKIPKNIDINKKVNIVDIILLFIFITLNIQAQDYKIITYNMSFNGLVSGIGSVIHKDNDQTTLNVFTKGFCKGAIGGAVIYGSKKIVNQINTRKNYWFGLYGKMVNSIGTSIVWNSSMNEKMFSNYYINIGFIRYNTNYKRHNISINPISFSIFTYALADKRFEFDPLRSLQTGTLIYKFDYFDNLNIGHGVTLNNVVLSHKDDLLPKDNPRYYLFNEHCTVAHEIIHSFQFEEFQILNTYHNKILKKWINIDIPYNGIPYLLMTGFYEYEAKYFSE